MKDVVRLRYASGSGQTCFDPEISEWGNPLAWERKYPLVSKVASEERTEGTETSKYLEEYKSTEILLVAASERRLAQTSMRACWGCRTCIKQMLLGEVSGKSHHREWKSRIRKRLKWASILSRMGHVKPCLNLGGPPSKAKYYLLTDSVQVPWGKGEKNPDEGSEIESWNHVLTNSQRAIVKPNDVPLA
jgi:hypothetical protein